MNGASSGAGADLLSMGAPAPNAAATSHDPFAPAPTSQPTLLGTMGSASSEPLGSTPVEPQTSNITEGSAEDTKSATSAKRSIMGGSTSQEAISALDELAAMSLQDSGVSEQPPPPLPSEMPPPPPPQGDVLPSEPADVPPPPLPNEMALPPPPPMDDAPELPPPEDMPPAPPPVLDLKDENLAAEFGAMGAMGGEVSTWKPPTPPPEMPPPPPPPEPLSMGGGGSSMMMGGTAPQQSLGMADGLGMMGGGGGGAIPAQPMDMNAMMQAVQSGSMSQEEQQRLMQQMMMMTNMMMMNQQQQNQQGGPPM